MSRLVVKSMQCMLTNQLHCTAHTAPTQVHVLIFKCCAHAIMVKPHFVFKEQTK